MKVEGTLAVGFTFDQNQLKQMKFLCAMILASVAFQVVAQPTLTASNMNPVVGETFSMAVVSGGGSFDVGGTGANQTYNFASLSGTGTPVTMVAPGSTGVGGQFSGATVASSFSSYYSFYTTSNSSIALKGNYSSGIAYVYSDTKTMLTYPMTLNTSFNDAYVNSYTVSGLTTTSNGETSVIADGYGTLYLPWGTVTDVLRVVETDSYTATSSMNTSNVTGTVYSYYKAGVHMPLVTVSTYSTNGFGGPTTVTMLTELPSSVLEVETSANIDVFPNPANDMLNVPNLKNGDKLLLFDGMGKLVWSEETKFGQSQFSLSEVANGVYELMVISDQRRLQTTLVIDKR